MRSDGKANLSRQMLARHPVPVIRWGRTHKRINSDARALPYRKTTQRTIKDGRKTKGIEKALVRDRDWFAWKNDVTTWRYENLTTKSSFSPTCESQAFSTLLALGPISIALASSGGNTESAVGDRTAGCGRVKEDSGYKKKMARKSNPASAAQSQTKSRQVPGLYSTMKPATSGPTAEPALMSIT